MTARMLGPADYRVMPWANGGGSTTELLRRDDANGAMLWRLSMASVAEDGAFSIFPQIERNLTVIEGPGFDLVGKQLHLRADPLVPVEFAGDIAISARNVTAPAIDFNVMVARHLGGGDVVVLRQGQSQTMAAPNGAIFSLGPAQVSVDGTVVKMDRQALWLGVLGNGAQNHGPNPILLVGLPVGV